MKHFMFAEGTFQTGRAEDRGGWIETIRAVVKQFGNDSGCQFLTTERLSDDGRIEFYPGATVTHMHSGTVTIAPKNAEAQAQIEAVLEADATLRGKLLRSWEVES